MGAKRNMRKLEAFVNSADAHGITIGKFTGKVQPVIRRKVVIKMSVIMSALVLVVLLASSCADRGLHDYSRKASDRNRAGKSTTYKPKYKVNNSCAAYTYGDKKVLRRN